MLRSLAAAAVAATATAQTWYGIAPDSNVGGLINLFSMNTQGAPIHPVASVVTNDQEYPKSGTLHCLWTSPMCYFLTGVGRPYVQDAIYGVNRTSGQVVFKHEVPAGIYLDNLVLDYATDALYSVAFDPQARTAHIVSYDGATGVPTILLDISRDVGAGFVFSGSVTICPGTKSLFVGLDVLVADGSFADVVLEYDYSGAVPKLNRVTPLLFPIPSAVHAFCNATSLIAMAGDYIQANSNDREKLVVGNIVEPGREGLFFPFAKGDLPTFNARGQVSLFLNGMFSEHAGTFLIPVFPAFKPGPGPAPALPGGLLFSWTFTGRPGPDVPRLSPIGYYLAGAAGVPGQ